MIVFGGPIITWAGSNYGYYLLSAAAFSGAMFTAFTIYRLAMYQRRKHIAALLFAGIAINAMTFSFTGLLTYLSTDEQLRNITFWGWGGLGGANWLSTGSAALFIAAPLLILPKFGNSLNALALGETQVGHIGFNLTVI